MKINVAWVKGKIKHSLSSHCKVAGCSMALHEIQVFLKTLAALKCFSFFLDIRGWFPWCKRKLSWAWRRHGHRCKSHKSCVSPGSRSVPTPWEIWLTHLALDLRAGGQKALLAHQYFLWVIARQVLDVLLLKRRTMLAQDKKSSLCLSGTYSKIIHSCCI